MNNLITTIVLDDVNLEDNLDLLQIISKVNDNVKLQFSFPVLNITDMFTYYVEHTAEHIKDIREYDCICPDIIDKYGDGEYFFTLNSIDDEESQSDVDFLQNELKRQFGINLKNDCRLTDLFMVLLMDCCSYDIIDDILTIKIYYKNYKESWIKSYLEK